MNIKPGTRIAFVEQGDEIMIRPLDKTYFEKFQKGSPKVEALSDELMKEKSKKILER